MKTCKEWIRKQLKADLTGKEFEVVANRDLLSKNIAYLNNEMHFKTYKTYESTTFYINRI